MKEGFVDACVAIIADNEPSEISQPGERPFYFPSMPVAAQRPPILLLAFAALSMRADQLDALVGQMLAQAVAVVSTVGNQPPDFLSLSWCNAVERVFDQCHFRRAGFQELASQRYTFAVDHHHPLCTLSTLGFSNAVAPFLAGAKLPSMKHWSQSSFCSRSSSLMNARHRRSHTPSSSQSRKRRQHVEALGYSEDRSRQRAPLRKTQSMPSRTRRLSANGRPRLLSLGNKGAMRFHCSSDKNGFAIPSFSQKIVQSTSVKSTKYDL